MSSPLDLATVEASFFEGLVGQHYTARAVYLADQSTFDLELIQVQAVHHQAGASSRTPFALLFRPDDISRLRQDTYHCDGPSVEGAAIFLVPTSDPQHGLCLVAVFN